jgi:hypothetical protein
LGYSESEYANLSNDLYRDFIHTDDVEKVQQTIDKIAQSKTGDVIEMTIRVRKCDGDYIWLYSRQMIYERRLDDQVFTIIREVEDVTKLVVLQDDLEGKVGQLKTVSFKNSHLLRSPVASIICLVGFVEEHQIVGEHNRQIPYILKEAITKLDHVIHEINDVVRF